MTNSPGEPGPVAAGNGTVNELRNVLNEQLEPVRDYLATMGMALAGIDEEIRSLKRAAPAPQPTDHLRGELTERRVEELREAVWAPDNEGEELIARVGRLAEYLDVAASHIETIRREEGGLAAIRTDVSESVIAMTNRVTTEVEALRASVTSHLTYVSSQIDAVKTANDNVAGAVSDTSGMQQQVLAAVADVQDAVTAQLGEKLDSVVSSVESGSNALAEVAADVASNRETVLTKVEELKSELEEFAGAVAAAVTGADESNERTTNKVAEVGSALTALQETLAEAITGRADLLTSEVGQLREVTEGRADALTSEVGQLREVTEGRADALTSELGQLREVTEGRADAFTSDLGQLREVTEGRADALTSELAELREELSGILESTATSQGSISEELQAVRTAIIDTVTTSSSLLDRRDNERVIEVRNRIGMLGAAVEESAAAISALQERIASHDPAIAASRAADLIHQVRTEMRGDLTDLASRVDNVHQSIGAVSEAITAADLNMIQASVMALAEASAAMEAGTTSGIGSIQEAIAGVTERLANLATVVGEGASESNNRSDVIGNEVAELKAALVGVGRAVNALEVPEHVATAQTAIVTAVEQQSGALQTQVADIRRMAEELATALAETRAGLGDVNVSEVVETAHTAIISVIDERARNLDARTGHRIDGVEERLAAVIDGITRLSAALSQSALPETRDALLSAIGHGSETVNASLASIGREVDRLAEWLREGGAAQDLTLEVRTTRDSILGAVADSSAASSQVATELEARLASAQEALVAAIDERARTLDGRTARRLDQVETRVAEGVAQVAAAVAALDPEATREAVLAAVAGSTESLTAQADEVSNRLATEVADLKSALVGVGRAVNAIDIAGGVESAVGDMPSQVADVSTMLTNLSSAMGAVASAFGDEDLPHQLGAVQEAIVTALDERARTLDRLSRNRVEPLNQRLNDLVAELDRVRSSLADQVTAIGEVVQTEDRDRAILTTLASLADTVADARSELLAAASRSTEAAAQSHESVATQTEQSLARVLRGQADLEERLAEVSRSSVVALDRATSIANQLVPNIDGLAEVAMERTAAVERRLDQLLSRLQPDSARIEAAVSDALRSAFGPVLNDVLERIDSLAAAEQRHAGEIIGLRTAVESLGVPAAPPGRRPLAPEDFQEDPGAPDTSRRRRRS